MKIQTNAGEVTLTAEMVCRGMVFAPKDPRDYVMGEGRVFVVGHRDEANGVWRDARDENLGTNVFGADRLLGCDPAIATRADCERYGVHGDAAAHGFARLRGGGAVDLRRSLPVGAVYVYDDDPNGVRAVVYSGPAWLPEGARFVGMHRLTRHASPEDVRRLCCGAEHLDNEQYDPHRCTLAIGDHDTHEDLATGVKWSAGADFNANLRAAAAIAEPREWTAEDIQRRVAETFAASAVAGWKVAQESVTKFAQALGACPNCGGDDATCRGSLAGLKACAAKGGRHILRIDDGGTYVRGNENYRVGVDPAQSGTEATAFVSAAMRKAGESLAALGEAAKHAAESAMPVPAAAAIKWEMGTASLGQSQAHILRDGDVYRWQVNHLGLRIRDGVEPHASPAMQRAGDLLRDVHAATAGIEWLAGFFGLLFRIHDATPAAKRAKQEAPLVALVAAVPEGLDPIGWRAAVLAVHEHHGRFADRLRGDLFAEWLAFVLREGFAAGEVDGYHGLGYLEGLDAYHRAITPAPKVAPERPTWKTRGPVLPCDNGEDE